MAPRLSGQTSIFGGVFFVSKSLLGIEGQKKLKNFAILSWKARSHVRILIYQTWLILSKLSHGKVLFPRRVKHRLFCRSSISLMSCLRTYLIKFVIMVIPPNSNALSVWRKTFPCHGSKPTKFLRRIKLANSLSKRHLNFRLARDQSCSLKQRQICLPAGVKHIIFPSFLHLTCQWFGRDAVR